MDSCYIEYQTDLHHTRTNTPKRVQIYLKLQNTIFLVEKYGIHPIYLGWVLRKNFRNK